MTSRRIDGPNGVSFTFADDDPTTDTKTTTPPRPALTDAPADHPLAYDADVARYAQNAVASSAPRTASDATSTRPAPNDDILYLGTNTTPMPGPQGKQVPQWQMERDALAWKSGGKCTTITPSTSDTIAAAGKTYDLAKPADVDAWSKTLGLPADRAAAVATAIKNASPNGRDELAQIATVWAKGELGGSVPSRLVLSGHYADHIADASGNTPNGVDARDIQALAKAMPNAAARVEDIMVSACYGGSKDQIDAWRGAFPNAKSVWAYGKGGHEASDKSPTAFAAIEHLVEWEKETRGRALPNAKPQTEMDAMGKLTLQNVSVWRG
jgi:hypothetical protein